MVNLMVVAFWLTETTGNAGPGAVEVLNVELLKNVVEGVRVVTMIARILRCLYAVDVGCC